MKSVKPIKILLADDDPDDRDLFTEAFSETDVVVKCVNNGAALMEELNNSSELPDFIFLDLNMPEKNGRECLNEIRSHARLKDLFVIIYSTSSSRKDIDDTFEMGGSLYITKPNTFKELQKTMNSILAIDWQQVPTQAARNAYVFKAS